MLEIPDLTDDERFQHIIGMHLGSTFYPLWYLEATYGADARAAYLDWLGTEFVTALERHGAGSPMKLVMMFASTEQNIMGSTVRVDGDDDRAHLDLVRCRRLEQALAWARFGTGRERAITRDGYCDLCLETGLRMVAQQLGFSFAVEFTDLGCRQTMASASDPVPGLPDRGLPDPDEPDS